MSKHDQPAGLHPYRCYRIGETLYIPHYTERYWVEPGYGLHRKRVFTNVELMCMGAAMEVHLLWKRKEHKEISAHE